MSLEKYYDKMVKWHSSPEGITAPDWIIDDLRKLREFEIKMENMYLKWLVGGEVER